MRLKDEDRAALAAMAKKALARRHHRGPWAAWGGAAAASLAAHLAVVHWLAERPTAVAIVATAHAIPDLREVAATAPPVATAPADDPALAELPSRGAAAVPPEAQTAPTAIAAGSLRAATAVPGSPRGAPPPAGSVAPVRVGGGRPDTDDPDIAEPTSEPPVPGGLAPLSTRIADATAIANAGPIEVATLGRHAALGLDGPAVTDGRSVTPAALSAAPDRPSAADASALGAWSRSRPAAASHRGPAPLRTELAEGPETSGTGDAPREPAADETRTDEAAAGETAVPPARPEDLGDTRVAAAAGPLARARVIVHHVADNPGPAEALARLIRAAGAGEVETRAVALRITSANARIFHPGDASLAAAVIGAAGMPMPVRDFRHYRPQPSPGTVELWIPG